MLDQSSMHQNNKKNEISKGSLPSSGHSQSQVSATGSLYSWSRRQALYMSLKLETMLQDHTSLLRHHLEHQTRLPPLDMVVSAEIKNTRVTPVTQQKKKKRSA
jgi:hypothetical protein